MRRDAEKGPIPKLRQQSHQVSGRLGTTVPRPLSFVAPLFHHQFARTQGTSALRRSWGVSIGTPQVKF